MMIRTKINVAHLFLESIKVIDDDTNEKIQNKERSHDNKNNKIHIGVHVGFKTRLLVHL